MEEDLQKKLEEEREHMKGEVDKMFQEQMAAIMTRMQQDQPVVELQKSSFQISLPHSFAFLLVLVAANSFL
ncbi:hypothetical protein H5410_052588 [Solanum commersonii]|uniref:Uncharacterized protein n=1 Tax=Solanum commersonii TaxID=4109 RepID=A0A9J5X186_SOLCO|nr:hypothetical protein H5410_052588 [Solanum commersonii]